MNSVHTKYDKYSLFELDEQGESRKRSERRGDVKKLFGVPHFLNTYTHEESHNNGFGIHFKFGRSVGRIQEINTRFNMGRQECEQNIVCHYGGQKKRPSLYRNSCTIRHDYDGDGTGIKKKKRKRRKLFDSPYLSVRSTQTHTKHRITIGKHVQPTYITFYYCMR